MTTREPTRGRIILRVNREGKVAAINSSARRVLGNYCVGKPCDEVVRGKTEANAALCRPGCAQDLALGRMAERGEQRARLGAHAARTRIECSRVGDEVHVLIENPVLVDATERLTPRERRVLALVSKGFSTNAISQELGISVATVRTHVEHARGRLGATTRAQAVLIALQTGQLENERG